MSSGRALEALLDQLHGTVAQALLTELKLHADALETEGTPIPPQFLDKVLKFLASNGINSPAQAPRIDALAQELEDIDLDAIASRRH